MRLDNAILLPRSKVNQSVARFRRRFAADSRLFCAVSHLFRGCRTGCFARFAAVSRLFHGCFAG
eukprot:4350418-Prymnesium_polylepis.1